MIKIEEESISTKEEFQIIDITDKIEKDIKKNKIKRGIVVITTKHTTTAIRVNENEPLLIKDISNFLNELVSKDKDYFHDDISKRKNCPEDEPKNAHAHLKALLMGASETIPIKEGKLSLGKWQRIFFIELDGPRERTFSYTFVTE
jgi:secondary thiamine-phosphate synthase enzyme